MRSRFSLCSLILLVLAAGILTHVAGAQDVFASGDDPTFSDPQPASPQAPDQGDVFATNGDDSSTGDVFSGTGDDPSYTPPTLGDLFSSVGSDTSPQQQQPSSDPIPTNPFFGMEFRLLAEVAELEEQKPQSGLPLPPGVRSQLLQAAAQMDNAATNTQNYSLAATNRFFHCMSEAVSADLRFLAQPGYVPAAQMAKALHQGVWSYLTSNAYSNNLAMYDAAVQSMQHAMHDPACVFGQAAPGIIAVGVLHTASAMAEARQVSRAANAAIALEETAETNGNPRWYVPGLRCEGCLVYGTAEGDYANFAGMVGGRTINSIPKPMNLTWQQFSAQVLDSAAQTKTPVLFSLQDMKQLKQVLAGTAYQNKVTSFELRYIQQNWSKFQNIVRFYNNGAQVPPPWE